MNEAHIAFIKQRMAMLGYKEFYWEPVRVQDATAAVEVAAHSEYYYLIAKSVDATLKIISDGGVFNEAADYAGFDFYRFQEFTGQIFITQVAGPIDIEFIRVIPSKCENEIPYLEAEDQVVNDNLWYKMKQWFNKKKVAA
jgi:hypothetical protein